MRKTIAKAVTWRLIGTAEIFAISFWTTGHIAMAGHTAGIAAITSIVMYVAHELAWESRQRESFFFCWDDRAARRLRPDLVCSMRLWKQVKALGRGLQKQNQDLTPISSGGAGSSQVSRDR
jgi:uncharacterized membrane protein